MILFFLENYLEVGYSYPQVFFSYVLPLTGRETKVLYIFDTNQSMDFISYTVYLIFKEKTDRYN